ncbi:MAG: LURP-one-related family protein [Phycisphaeraceae bacterium]|nr:LURP-one-related family protein [Phycisphaeraceae bacterium]
MITDGLDIAMIYMLKQKIFSLATRFVIKDGNEQDAFYVEGKIFSWGNKLSVTDVSGREVAFIAQRLMSWRPRYEIQRDGQVIATVIREFTFFKARYSIEVPGSDHYAIQGDIWSHEYVINHNHQLAASVSKRFWSWSDTYGIEIQPGEDDVLILCAAVVIDLVCHCNRKSS